MHDLAPRLAHKPLLSKCLANFNELRLVFASTLVKMLLLLLLFALFFPVFTLVFTDICTRKFGTHLFWKSLIHRFLFHIYHHIAPRLRSLPGVCALNLRAQFCF